MMNSGLVIERITEANYHMFDDMVFWRINGFERTNGQKRECAKSDFEDAFVELAHNHFYVFAARQDERFVGWIALVYIPKVGKWNGGIIFVDELWVAPEYRKKGIATQLMQKAVEIQHGTKAVKIRLYTSNTPARRLYEKCGLKVIDEAVFMEMP